MEFFKVCVSVATVKNCVITQLKYIFIEEKIIKILTLFSFLRNKRRIYKEVESCVFLKGDVMHGCTQKGAGKNDGPTLNLWMKNCVFHYKDK